MLVPVAQALREAATQGFAHSDEALLPGVAASPHSSRRLSNSIASPTGVPVAESDLSRALTNEAIAYYQVASEAYKRGDLKRSGR